MAGLECIAQFGEASFRLGKVWVAIVRDILHRRQIAGKAPLIRDHARGATRKLRRFLRLAATSLYAVEQFLFRRALFLADKIDINNLREQTFELALALER